jgi:hypothetical protein
MRRSTSTLALAGWALLGLALAQTTLEIGLGETRTGTIPSDEIDHRYVLTLPEGVARVVIAVTAGGDDADLAVTYLTTGERLFEDLSSEPDPTFALESPQPGSYEILVKNLVWQPLDYTLSVSGAGPPAPAAEDYYVAQDGAAVGPMGLAALVERIERGETRGEDLVWRPGLDGWLRADAVAELAPRFVVRPTPPPLPPSAGPTPPPLAPSDAVKPGAPAAPVAPATPPASASSTAPRDGLGAVDPAAGWQAAGSGDLCLWAPPGWHDVFGEVEGFVSEEGVAVVAAWSAVPSVDDMGALLAVYRVTDARLREMLEDTAVGPATDSYGERAGDVGGRPGTWRSVELAAQGRMWIGYPKEPDADGRYLVIVGHLGADRGDPWEAALLAAFDAVGPCSGEVADVPGGAALPDLRLAVGCGETARDAALRALPVGASALVTCPADCSGERAVWGTDLYTDDSSICRAAIHAGLLGVDRGGAVVLTIQPGASRYEGSVRNGVTTRSYGAWGRSFGFEPGAAAGLGLPAGAAAAGVPYPGRTAAVTVPLGTLRGNLTSARTEARHVIDVDRDGDLHVRATADLNVVLHLLDPNGATLASATSGYATERTLERVGLAPGSYVVAIARDGGSSEGGYAITVELRANTTGSDPEPNDAAAEARPAPLDAAGTGRLGYGDAAGSDTEDWFQLTTGDDGDLAVTVDADPTLQIVVYLHGADGRTTLATDTSGWASTRTVSVEGLARGSYLLRVARDGRSGQGGYAIAPAFGAVATPNDVEPNDAPGQARAIAIDGPTHGRLGYRDGTSADTEDHFVITTTRVGELGLSAQAGLDVVLYLTDASGSLLASDTSGYATRRTVTRADLPAGRYLVRIARDGSSGRGAYLLEPRFTGR